MMKDVVAISPEVALTNEGVGKENPPTDAEFFGGFIVGVEVKDGCRGCLKDDNVLCLLLL
jgi:hypothetical protein